MYPGIDRFGRVIRDRWIPTGTFDPNAKPELIDWEYKYAWEDDNENPLNNIVPSQRIDRRGSENEDYFDHWKGDDWSYTFDGLNRLTGAVKGTGSPTSSDTDEPTNIDVTLVSPFGANSELWSPDHLGNWLSSALDLTKDGDFVDSNESVSRTHNQANQLTQIGTGSDSLSYDVAGNLIERVVSGTTWRYAYDAWNRLTYVTVQGPSDLNPKDRARFGYNALGQRTWRWVDTGTSATNSALNGVLDQLTLYYYDAQWRIVEEHVAKDPEEDSTYVAASVLQRVWGPGGDEMLFYQRDTNADGTTNNAYYALLDHLGSVVALVQHDDPTVVSERVHYSPYGTATVLPRQVGDTNEDLLVNIADSSIISGAFSTAMGINATYTLQADLDRDGDVDIGDYNTMAGAFGQSTTVPAGAISKIGNTIGYAGYVWDPALGGNTTGAYLARNRWYSPNLGRWVSRDPIGFGGGDMNLYGYVAGMPGIATDPMGLESDFEKALRQRDEFGLVRRESKVLAGEVMHPRRTLYCARHEILDYFAMWPGIDIAADGLHAILYWAEGRYGEAGFTASTMFLIGPSSSWSTARRHFWKAFGAAPAALDEFGPANVQRMLKGKPPLHPEVGVPMELHHKKARRDGGTHDPENLQPMWPWTHDDVDPFRHYRGPRPSGG